jgi:Family of unknown function (DUF5681)
MPELNVVDVSEMDPPYKTGKGRPPLAHMWKKGQSGNTGGRPRGKSLRSRILDLLEKRTYNGRKITNGRQIGDLVAEAIIDHIISGKASSAAIFGWINNDPIQQTAANLPAMSREKAAYLAEQLAKLSEHYDERERTRLSLCGDKPDPVYPEGRAADDDGRVVEVAVV